MKNIFTFLIVAFAISTGSAQNNDDKISFDGIGPLKMGLTKSEVEKLLNTRITLKHIHVDEVYAEDVQVKYKGADFILSLMRSETDVAFVDGIQTSSPLFKMSNGIGVGSDELTIINAFEDQLLIIAPEYENTAPDIYTPSKSKSTITLASIKDEHLGIIFKLVNKKVVSIQVTYTPEFRDRE